MTRARPANLSDSVPASLDKAVCVVCARSGARLSTAAIATAQVIVLVRIVLIDISCFRLSLDCYVVPVAAHAGLLPCLSYGRYFLGSRAVADSACTMMPVT